MVCVWGGGDAPGLQSQNGPWRLLQGGSCCCVNDPPAL
eukprot:COSAG03_NODE_29381_length_185_cov_25.767442_1_plen_37_part_10